MTRVQLHFIFIIHFRFELGFGLWKKKTAVAIKTEDMMFCIEKYPKVKIFWEGHKILALFHILFDIT